MNVRVSTLWQDGETMAAARVALGEEGTKAQPRRLCSVYTELQPEC